MFDLTGCFLLIVGSLSGLLAGSPTIIYVPWWAQGRVALPRADCLCTLRAPGLYADIVGRQCGNEGLQDLVENRNPGVVYIYADLNRFPPGQLASCLGRLRKDWSPSIRTVIFIMLSRQVDSPRTGMSP
jgi:hypothetical protein